MPFEWLSAPQAINGVLAIVKTLSAPFAKPKVVISPRWAYEPDANRFAFNVDVKNDENHPIIVDSVAIVHPGNGSLRKDPPVLLWRTDLGRDVVRERDLGPAASVIGLNLEICPGELADFAFTFTPPQGWRGGRFVAEIRTVMHGPKETHGRTKITRQLSPRPPDSTMRAQGTSQSAVAERISVVEAIDRFCDPELIAARNERREELSLAQADYGAAEQRSTQIRAVFGWARQTSLQMEFKVLQAESMFTTLMENGLTQSLANIEAELVDLLVGGLASGKLIARGYAEPYKAGADEITVPTREWRILSLTDAGSAIRKGTQVPVYSDVQISQSSKGEPVRLISRRKLAPIIGILLKPGMHPYIATDRQGERTLSTARIGIRNFGRTALSNCKLYITDVSPAPPLPGGFPILLEGGGFTLRPDDPDKLIDIATHWNHVDEFRFAAPAGHFAETLSYIDDKEQRTLTLKIQATECHRSAQFRIGTDPFKALHLEFMGYLD